MGEWRKLVRNHVDALPARLGAEVVEINPGGAVPRDGERVLPLVASAPAPAEISDQVAGLGSPPGGASAPRPSNASHATAVTSRAAPTSADSRALRPRTTRERLLPTTARNCMDVQKPVEFMSPPC